jgi:hypothetical protein
MIHTKPTPGEIEQYLKLPKDERPIIMIAHDECAFQSNIDEAWAWRDDSGKGMRARKKGEGAGYMVSGFLTELDGLLKDDKGEILVKYLQYGSGNWWHSELMQAHLKEAIAAFDKQYPWGQALFLFDHSSNHKKKADDALDAKKMNVSDGGKQPKMHDTEYLKVVHNGKEIEPEHQYRVKQKMTHKDGTQKGLRTVLEERGHSHVNLKRKHKDELVTMLLQYDDFNPKNQRTLLQDIVLQSGHLFQHFPK